MWISWNLRGLALQLAFEQMVRRLTAEGLFADEHKKPIPAYPMRIGILTSESGAAIHDIEESIHSRWPCAKLFLYDVPVQGEGAAEEIAKSIRAVNRRNKTLKLDIVIVGRGGGSLEDLWAFNEEVLARAIYDSKIPVISAVGHEYDTTIADLVADARASTPTKAGMIAVPDVSEVLEQLGYYQKRLESKIQSKLESYHGNLMTLLASAVFKNPLGPVFIAAQKADELEAALSKAIREIITGAKEKTRLCYEQVVKIEPHRLLGRKMVDINNLENRTNAAINAIMNRRQLQLTAQAARLQGLNPKSVLQRGYSITSSKKTGQVIAKVDDVEIGDTMITELASENFIESEVKIKQNKCESVKGL